MNGAKALREIREETGAMLGIIERMEHLRTTLYGKALTYDGDVIQVSPSDTFGARMAEICDHDIFVKRRMRDIDMRKDILRAALIRMPSEDQAKLLDLYYLTITPEGKLYTWSDVAKELEKDENYTRNTLKQRAIENFNNILYIC